jgi:hypothetical protein
LSIKHPAAVMLGFVGKLQQRKLMPGDMMFNVLSCACGASCLVVIHLDVPCSIVACIFV